MAAHEHTKPQGRHTETLTLNTIPGKRKKKNRERYEVVKLECGSFK